MSTKTALEGGGESRMDRRTATLGGEPMPKLGGVGNIGFLGKVGELRYSKGVEENWGRGREVSEVKALERSFWRGESVIMGNMLTATSDWV